MDTVLANLGEIVLAYIPGLKIFILIDRIGSRFKICSGECIKNRINRNGTD